MSDSGAHVERAAASPRMQDRDHGALSGEEVVRGMAELAIGDLYKVKVDGEWVYLRRITAKEYEEA